jgi:putative flippase GtrA
MAGMTPSESPLLRYITRPVSRVGGSREIAGQGLRFGLAGGVVAVVYLASTSLLAEVLGVDFEVALAMGFALAIATHFVLQRRYVWVHADGFAVTLRQQALRYLLVASLQYGLTAVATSALPGLLHVATEVVYLCSAAALTATNFVVFRTGVFHAADPPKED